MSAPTDLSKTSRPQSREAAILGGGVIGGGWAARFLIMGWDVAVFDPDPNAGAKLEAVLQNARRALPSLMDGPTPPEGRLRMAETVEDAVRNAAWIQESAPERLELKQKLLADVQAACPQDAVIGSSTSGFKPSELQAGAMRPEQILVAHPFNPVYLLPLVELVGAHETPAHRLDHAADILRGIGMAPLKLRREIDAHIADRLMEAVWREALWLINDEIATTEEVDEAIRLGFGLRWAQMGLFETFRIAGGEAGMRHFIQQFGPALQWPWTKLTDVPELSDALVERIAEQSDAQAAGKSIRDLERLRDTNLVAILRALKAQNVGAGAHLNGVDAARASELRRLAEAEEASPIVTVRRTIPLDWTDYNGHMNESRYGQVFSDAADAAMAIIGADAGYVATGNSYFTVETTTRFLAEAQSGDPIVVTTVVTEGAGKKLRLRHKMTSPDGRALAECDQTLIHVSLETRRACAPTPEVARRKAALAAAHLRLTAPSE